MSVQIVPFLAQTRHLSPIQESVKHQFEEGGSVQTALVVLAAIVAVVVVAGLISWVHQPSQAQTRGNQRKLFQRLLQQLPLSHRQRRFLVGMAKDLRLPNPTLLLLSPGYFSACVEQWEAGWQAGSTRRSSSRRSVDTVALERIRVAVFPKAGPSHGRSGPRRQKPNTLFSVTPVSGGAGRQGRR